MILIGILCEKNDGLGTPEVAFTSSTSSANIYTLKIHENRKRSPRDLQKKNKMQLSMLVVVKETQENLEDSPDFT